MKIKTIISICLCLFSTTAFAQQKKVAVYVTGKETGINKVLGDKLVAAFAKSGKYIAIERTASFLAELSKEQNYQRTGAVDDNELSRLGKQFGVQLVCVTDISDVFGEKYVSARLIDVESAEVVNTSNTNSKLDNMVELLKVADNIAKELTAKTVQEKAAEAAAREQEQATEKKRLEQAINDGYIQVDNIMFVVSKNVPILTFKRAEKAAKDCRVGEYQDWRLPTTSEMTRIKDITHRYNSINANFPDYSSGRWNYGCANNYYLLSDNKVGKGWIDECYRKYVVFVRDFPSK